MYVTNGTLNELFSPRSGQSDFGNMDVIEAHDEYLVFVTATEANLEDVTVMADDGFLHVLISKPRKTEKGNYLLKERASIYDARRKVKLPKADFDRAEARLENGVLALVVPKLSKFESKRIEVH